MQDNAEIPPLTEPLFDSVTVTPSRPEKFVILTEDEAYGENMGPPVYVAELTTYALELHLKDKHTTPKQAEHTLHSLERWMQKVIEGEAFGRYTDWDKPKKVILEGRPPVVKVRGLTFDMLKALIRYNLVESNLDVAHAFENAARVEYRGPLMSPLGRDHDPDEEYNTHPDPENFQRGKIDFNAESGIGDLGIAPPGQAYMHAVRSLAEGKSRGLIKGDEHLERAANFVAYSTLKGTLPSPYPTEQQLLGDGASMEDKQRVAEERLEKVLGDMQATGIQIQRLRVEEGDRKIPSWWLGSAEQYKREFEESFERTKAQFMERHEKLDAEGGLQKVLDDATRDWVGLTKKQTQEKQRKEEIKMRRERNAALSTRLSPAEREMFSWHDLSFFGVTHEMPIYTYDEGDWSGKSLDDYGVKKTYVSRNPLIDPPRELPVSLNILLEQERTKKAKLLPTNEERTKHAR